METEFQPASAGTAELCPPNWINSPWKKRLNTPEASEYLWWKHGLKVAVATLEAKRTRGGGPAFVKFGRTVLYEREALDQHAEDSLSGPKTSTSDNNGAA